MTSLYLCLSGNPDPITGEICNYTSMYRLYQRLRQIEVKVVIGDIDGLTQNPDQYLKKMGRECGLENPLGATEWLPISPEEMQQQWHEGKRSDLITKWHAKGMNSTSFARVDYPTIVTEPTFDYADQVDREYLTKLYSDNLKYYRLLLQPDVGGRV